MSILRERRKLIKALGTSVILCSSFRAAAHSQHLHDEEEISSGDELANLADGGSRMAEHSQIQAIYTMPHVPLLDQHGTPVDLARQLRTPGPVLMNFIFTSCPGICPIQSAVLSQALELLGADRPRMRLWSLSIDPDHDRPEQLRRYANAFHAPEQWHFLTGDAADVMQIRRAFNAASDSKMAHLPLFLLRQQEDRWLRLEGDVTASTLVAEAQELIVASRQ